MFRSTRWPPAASASRRSAQPQASPALLAVLHGLAERTERLLSESDVFPLLINDRRLALEVSVINTLAHRLTRILMPRDPLRDRVHLSVPAVAGLTLVGILARRVAPAWPARLGARRISRGVRE